MPDRREEGTFARWLAQVDRLIQARFQISLHDLPDMMTRHAFDNGVTPEQFFREDVLNLIREEFGDEAVDGDDR